MPWADRVPAILQAWYGGCESGSGLADVIYGQVNPSARLPMTFPQREEDVPAFLSFKSQRGVVRYNEDLHVGWKWYLDRKIRPLFPFAHGLSYSQFQYSAITITTTTPVDITFTVAITNTGPVPGSHSAVLYLSPPPPTADSLIHPSRRTGGIAHVEDLKVGESRTVSITIERRELGHWDDVLHCWTVERGQWRAFLAADSLGEALNEVQFGIETSTEWTGL